MVRRRRCTLRTSEDGDFMVKFSFIDLIAALEWMQAEIGSFGGDRNSITLLGHSAGGAASLYLSISPKMGEKHLFHRSISLSPSVRWLVDVNRDICDAIIDAVGVLFV